jgi:hypothetical protein
VLLALTEEIRWLQVEHVELQKAREGRCGTLQTQHSLVARKKAVRSRERQGKHRWTVEPSQLDLELHCTTSSSHVRRTATLTGVGIAATARWVILED